MPPSFGDSATRRMTPDAKERKGRKTNGECGKSLQISDKMYKQLHKEHLSLQRSFCSLYHHLGSDRQKPVNGKVTSTWLEDRQKLECIALYFHAKARHLHRELFSLKERCELLEFCLLESESKGQVTGCIEPVDCGVNTDVSWISYKGIKKSSAFSSEKYIWSSLSEKSNEIPICCNCDSSGTKMDKEQCCLKLAESQKKLYAISRQLDLVAKEESERDGGAAKRCLNYLIPTITELHSLLAWFTEKNGAPEESDMITEKLRQLESIRKGLERTISESQNLWCHSAEKDSPACLQGEQLQIKNLQPVESAAVEKTLHQKISTTPVSSKHGIVEYKERLSFVKDSFNEVNESAKISKIPENESDNVYIATPPSEQNTEKLTTTLESQTLMEQQQFLSKSTNHLAKDICDQPDSLGTVVSEDEGLGDESRRGDYTGPNSLLEISDTALDIVIDTSTACIRDPKILEPELRDPRNSIELCLCTISKLRESLSLKEKELLACCQRGNSEVSELKNIIFNQQQTIDTLKLNLSNLKTENASLKEQVLELEEAENDARLQGQRLQERLIFLQEKDSHFQTEFCEAKHTLEICIEELALKESEHQDLRSQLKYMEVLIQKYEEQIKNMESEGFILRDELSKMKEELKVRQSKLNEEHRETKGTQTYSVISKIQNNNIEENNNSDAKASEFLNQTTISENLKSESVNEVRNQDHCFETNLSTISTVSSPKINISNSTKDANTQFDSLLSNYESIKVDGATQTEHFNTNEHEVNNKSLFLLETDVDEYCYEGAASQSSNQEKLQQRLHHLVKEDANLQQQLHTIDEQNLSLWKKLHDLQFHVGECQKENIVKEDLKKTENSFFLSNCNIFTEKNASISPASENLSKDSLENTESYLRERLIQLEKINLSFEKELDVRENLFQERERKHEEWLQTEDRFMEDLKNFRVERDLLLTQVTRLESEKSLLASRVEELEKEVLRTRAINKQETEQLVAERDEIVMQLKEKINKLLIREKDYLRQINTLRKEKKTKDDATEIEKMKTSYVQLQIELQGCRSEMEKTKDEFDCRLATLNKNHELKETKIQDELKTLRQKDQECSTKLKSFQLRHEEREEALKKKECELELARVDFKKKIMQMEEEHRSIEAQLKTKLREIEERTAVATKALTEERVRLEKELQENIDDLRSKESHYETRIAELESEVAELREALCAEEASGESSLTCELRRRLEEAEQRETAYRETLAAADRLVAAAERGYRHRVEELEHSERMLRDRVAKLEIAEARLRGALRGRTPDTLRQELEEAEKREGALRAEKDALEQSLKSTLRKAKELEKERKLLETQLEDRDALEESLEKERRERETVRKDLSRLKASEEGLKAALQEATTLAETRQSRTNEELKRLNSEKRILEEALDQMRRHVRELEQGVVEKEEAKISEASSLHAEAAATLPPMSWCCFNHNLHTDNQKKIHNELKTTDGDTKCNYVAEKLEEKVNNRVENNELLVPVPCLFSPLETSFSDQNSNNMKNNNTGKCSTVVLLKKLDANLDSKCESTKHSTSRKEASDPKSHFTSDIILAQNKKPQKIPVSRSTFESGDYQRYPFQFYRKQDDDKSVELKPKSKTLSVRSSEANFEAEEEDCVARLEECMLRAMDAMKMDIEQMAPSASAESLGDEYKIEVQPPFNFRVVQQVGSDTVLVGWEYGDASYLEGFEIYVNGHLQETVYVSDRRRAVISNLDMTQPVNLSLRALSVYGYASEMCMLDLKAGRTDFFFQDDSDEDDDDLFADDVDGLSDKQKRPYSVEW